MATVQKNYTIQNLEDVAEWLWQHIRNYKVIALHGDMGVGKTTLVSAICKYLGIRDVTSSPTFSIINEYQYEHEGTRDAIFHIDLYRLKSEEEAIHAGVEDCLYSGSYCFVEWPEQAPNLLPPDTIHLYLRQIEGEMRTLEIAQ